MQSSYSNPSLSWNDRQLNLFQIPSFCANTYLLSSPINWRNTYLRTISRSTTSTLLDCPSQIVAPSVPLCLLPATGWAMGAQGPSFPSPAPPHSLLLETVERRSCWSQHDKLALVAHWRWAGNWIIRHTFPLMGFLPPCLCRSFGRIKASMYHRYVKEKSSVKMECSWRVQEKI